MICESFILELFILVLALYSHCEDKKYSTDFFQITCFKERKSWRDLMVWINFYKEQCLPVTTWNKKHLSKQLVTIAYTLEKKVFAVANFEGLGVIFFSDKVKELAIKLVCMTFPWISREDRPNEYCLWEINLFFFM